MCRKQGCWEGGGEAASPDKLLAAELVHLPERFRAVLQLFSPSHLHGQWGLFAFCSAWMDLMTLF